jgi:hypothetical protein
MHILKEVVGVIGSIILVYFSARIAATIADFCRHLYRTKGPEGRTISRHSMWPDLEKIVKACQDNGGYPWEQPVKIDLAKSSPEDTNLLSKINNPVDAVERRINCLFVNKGVAHLMEVRRKDNLLYICSPSW